MQVTDRFYRLLGVPALYTGFQNALGAAASRRTIVADYVRPRAGDRVLDIGCGPADILDCLPGVVYLGVDVSAAYIENARRRFGAAARFHCGSAYQLPDLQAGPF